MQRADYAPIEAVVNVIRKKEILMNRSSVIRYVVRCGLPACALALTRAGAALTQTGHSRIAHGVQSGRALLLLGLTWAMVSGGCAPALVASPNAGSTAGESNATTVDPAAVTTPYPTITNLSVEWPISGDANKDGVVTLRYRVAGDPTAPWREGMPLQRVPAGSNDEYSWPNKHSGSLFDLEPDTTYEIALTLTDPDNSSPIVTTVTTTTRAVPVVPPPSATGKQVTPATFASYAANANPSDVLNLGAGTYAGFMFSRDGRPGQPIIIRSTAGAVINGDVTLDTRKFVYLYGLTVNGSISYDGSDNVAVMHCTVTTTGDGIKSWTRSQNSYIADNVVLGVTPWAESSLGSHGSNVGEGILFNGPGHVITNNFVKGFRDNISTAEEVNETFSDDVLNNDITVAGDDGAEIDYCFHNCRVMRNRLTNTFMGLSSQPSLGGPTYFIRNVMYNVVYEALKLHNDTAGVVALHNTIVKSGDAFVVNDSSSIDHALFRNNLFIGGPGGTWNGYPTNVGFQGFPRVVSVPTWTSTADANYDAYGSVDGTFEGQFATTVFSSLAQMRSLTTETKAVQLLTQDIFPHPITGIFLNSVDYPNDPFPERVAPDLRLGAGSAAIDVGSAIPNINDGYVGAAPDAGAYEYSKNGNSLPVYGPR
jgi:hypothetical protein